MTTFVELFAGTGAVSWQLLSPGTPPPTSYMGGKRRMAPTILRALGLRPGQGCDRLVLVDAGPWGDVWRCLADRRILDVADRLDAFAREMGSAPTAPNDLWMTLAKAGRPNDLIERAAAYLWLQARAPSGVPVWWSCGSTQRRPAANSPRLANTLHMGDDVHRNGTPNGGIQLSGGHARDAEPLPAGCAPLRRPTGGKNDQEMIATVPAGINGMRQGKTGGREEPAYGPKTLMRPTANQTGAGPSTGPKGGGAPGMINPATIAGRLRVLHRLTADVEVIALSAHPWPGAETPWIDRARIYMDPPYVGAPRYAATCPRADVVALAEAYRAAGARVVVSEAEAVAGPPWVAVDVSHEAARPGKREWLTCSESPDPPDQLSLWGAA